MDPKAGERREDETVIYEREREIELHVESQRWALLKTREARDLGEGKRSATWQYLTLQQLRPSGKRL